jgi:creatinine amidohydrolase
LTNPRYEELRPDQLDAARQQAPLVYVPIGSLEYHGWHLPVGFDAMHAHALCLRAAERTGGVVLPPTFWGTRGHEGFRGSLLLQESTIAALARDILDQLAGQGYRLIVLFTGHWPEIQGGLLRRVAAEFAAATPGVCALVLDPFNLHPTDTHAEHAGRIETSVMLHLRPDLTDMAALADPAALQAIGPDCVAATAEYGQQRCEEVLPALVSAVMTRLRALPAPDPANPPA